MLTKLAAADADDLPVRKKLAQLAVAAGDSPAAARWALEALAHRRHRRRAAPAGGPRRCAAQGDRPRGGRRICSGRRARSRRTRRCGWRWPRRYVKAERAGAKPKRALEELLKRDPDYPGAEQLLESAQVNERRRAARRRRRMPLAGRGDAGRFSATDPRHVLREGRGPRHRRHVHVADGGGRRAGQRPCAAARTKSGWANSPTCWPGWPRSPTWPASI